MYRKSKHISGPFQKILLENITYRKIILLFKNAKVVLESTQYGENLTYNITLAWCYISCDVTSHSVYPIVVI